MVLRACYAISRTELAYAATQQPVLSYTMCGTELHNELAYATTQYAVGARLHHARAPHVRAPLGRAQHAAITLRGRYAMSGTDTAYAPTSEENKVPPAYAYAMRCPVPTCLRACYAMSRTDVAYAATRVLCDVLY
eukprot:3941274-Rhodomonas_salina.2